MSNDDHYVWSPQQRLEFLWSPGLPIVDLLSCYTLKLRSEYQFRLLLTTLTSGPNFCMIVAELWRIQGGFGGFDRGPGNFGAGRRGGGGGGGRGGGQASRRLPTVPG